jgi:hypothetical protein
MEGQARAGVREGVTTPSGPADMTIAVENTREKISTRKIIALGLLGLISVLLVTLLLGALFHEWDAKDTVALSAGIVSPIVGILGTAMGFYFGSHHQQ